MTIGGRDLRFSKEGKEHMDRCVTISRREGWGGGKERWIYDNVCMDSTDGRPLRWQMADDYERRTMNDVRASHRSIGRAERKRGNDDERRRFGV